MAENFVYIRLDRKDDIAEVVLNRPNKLNSMTNDFFGEIGRVFQLISDDPSIRVAIVWAEGKLFTAGLDLKEAATSLMPSKSDDQCNATENLKLYKHIKWIQDNLSNIQSCKKPVIAAIHGECIGGGVDLVTACDIRLCTADAGFSVKETQLAIVADLGTTQRLPKLIGKGPAREMCFTGDRVNATKALRYNLVNEVFADKQQLLEGARSLAKKIAANSPLVVQGTKKVLNYVDEHSIADGLEYVALHNSAFLLSNDLTEAVMGFMEKRRPVFKSNL